MTAAPVRKQDYQHWDALAAEVVERQRRFNESAYGGGLTPLEGFRDSLRRKRREHPQHSFGFPETAPFAYSPVPAPVAANDDFRIAWPQRRLTRVVASACLATVAIPLAVLGVHVASPATTEALSRSFIASIPNDAVKTINEARSCTLARPILDAKGALVDISPIYSCAGERPFLSAPVSTLAAEQMHLAWRASEGEYRISPVTYQGLNLKGWTRAVLQYVHVLAADVQSGGSGPLETGVKNLLGRPGQLGFSLKLRNGFDVLSYTANRLADDAARDRFVTESIPCVRGASASAFGLKLAGNLCPLYMFGKNAEQLDWAERCVWAGSALPLYRAIGPDTPEEAVEVAAQAKAWIRARAKDCLVRVGNELGWDAKQTAVFVARVETLEFPVGPSSQKGELARETVNLADTMAGLVFALRDELKLVRLAPGDTTIRLNVAAADYARAHERLLGAARSVEARLDPNLCLVNCTSDKRQADLVAFLAEIRGDQLAIVQGISNAHFLLTGPIVERDGKYERGRTTRSGGSTNKSMLLPKLVAAGFTTLCARVPVGLRSSTKIEPADGIPCSDGGGLVDLRRSIAVSLNAPFADGVYRLGIENTKAYFARLGYDFDPELTGAKAVDALVLGWGFTVAPITLVRNFAALYRGYLGEEPVTHLPALMASGLAEGRFDWREVGLSAAHLRRAGEILSAPIQDRGGTLRSLAPVLKRHGCSQPIGKTGSSDSVVATAVRDKIAVAAFRCHGRKYIAYAMIGSPRVDVPLGTVQAADLARLIDALLSARQPQED